MQDAADHTTPLGTPLAPEPVKPLGAFGRLARRTPSLLVFAALGSLLLWGHYTDWTFPKFSTLTGAASEGGHDWCEEHSVPESQCVECNPSLMPKAKAFGWCKRHGVHDCPLEHPEIAQTATIPRVTGDDVARAQRALDIAARPENNSKCKAHERRIQFTSQEAVERSGVEVEPVWKAPVVEYITGNGEITYDQTRTARLSSRVPGTVFRAFKQVGDRVQEGEVVGLVDAAEVGKAKSEFLQALVQLRLRAGTLSQLKDAAASGAVPERSYREQQSAVSEALIRLTSAQQGMTNLGLPVDAENLRTVPQDRLAEHLRFLGLPESLSRSLNPKTTTGNLLAVTAPFDGVVVARDVVAGEVVDTQKVLFVVVDPRQVWMMLDLRLEDAKAIRLGQTVRFLADGNTEEAVGTITWISTEADHKTRTVKIRAVLPNPEGRLRANTFGMGRIVVREESQAVVVPNGAVHCDGDCYLVFVRDKDFLKPGAPKVFHTRTVRLGVMDEKQTEIIAGVLPGELVATKGSAALRAQLLRANLGEG
jgi:cobalt-zinc-cadmium efflux system membrane fusion protein